MTYFTIKQICQSCGTYLLDSPEMPGWKKCPSCKFRVSKNVLENEVITLNELNPKGYALTNEYAANLNKLLIVMNKIRAAYGKPMVVNSGVRSDADQQRINPKAPKSKHISCQAVDIADSDGGLLKWVLANLDLMQTLGVFFEDFRWTPGWIHFQIVPPASGKRVFVPDTSPAKAAERWDGIYDHAKYDSK
jgi:hypothetical protein